MMYPFMTLNDDTEITHSEMQENGSIKVYIETPDEKDGFHHAVCWLPENRWEDIDGYLDAEMEHFKQLIHNNAHAIIEAAQDGRTKEKHQSSKTRFLLSIGRIDVDKEAILQSREESLI